MCVTDGHRTFCGCKTCDKGRRKIRIKWYIKNFFNGLKLMFQRKPKREVKTIRLSEIFNQHHFDLADPDYEWNILKESIEKEGLKEPIHVQRLRDLDPNAPMIDRRWMEHIANGRYYIPLDGNHRAGVLKYLAKGDPLATTEVVIIPMEPVPQEDQLQGPKEYSFFTAFYTPGTWDRLTDYGEILKRAKERMKNIEIKRKEDESNR